MEPIQAAATIPASLMPPQTEELMIAVELAAGRHLLSTRLKLPPGARPAYKNLKRLCRHTFHGVGGKDPALAAIAFAVDGLPEERVDVRDDTRFEAFWHRRVLVRRKLNLTQSSSQ